MPPSKFHAAGDAAGKWRRRRCRQQQCPARFDRSPCLSSSQHTAMEVAARPSGHKRGLTAYDSQLAEFDPSGKAARANEEETAEGEAEPQEEQLPLTERAAFSLTALRAAQEAVIQQMDELQGAGEGAGRAWERHLAGRRRRGAQPAAAAACSCGCPLHAWLGQGPGAAASLLHSVASPLTTLPPSNTASACQAMHVHRRRASAFPPSSRRRSF